MSVKAVIFDLDNTLYDYNYCNRLAEDKLLNEISKEFLISHDEAACVLSASKRNIKNRLCNNVAASHNRLLYMQNVCEQMGRNPLLYAMHFYNVYWDTMLEKMVLFDYVIPLFNELANRKIKIGILTDLTAHIQYRKINVLGISEYIDCITTSEEAGEEKPSAKGFELMLMKLGAQAEDVIMVGDSQLNDIEGAKRVGIDGVLCKNIETIYDEVISKL